jgi:hypothetical protein
MSDDAPTTDEEPRRRDHLRVITEPELPEGAMPARPRTIGRVIAQTALLADSAMHRRHMNAPTQADLRGVGRLLGRFR